MGVNSFKELMKHLNHNLVCVSYGKGEDRRNVAIECEDCNEVLLDFDKEIKEK